MFLLFLTKSSANKFLLYMFADFANFASIICQTTD